MLKRLRKTIFFVLKQTTFLQTSLNLNHKQQTKQNDNIPSINSLSTSPTKWVNTLKQFVGMPTIVECV